MQFLASFPVSCDSYISCSTLCKVHVKDIYYAVCVHSYMCTVVSYCSRSSCSVRSFIFLICRSLADLIKQSPNPISLGGLYSSVVKVKYCQSELNYLMISITNAHSYTSTAIVC